MNVRQFFLIAIAISTVQGGTDVDYTHGDVKLKGYLSMPSSFSVKSKSPAVLIAHAWKGVQQHEKDVADRLARSGIPAFVLDIYGTGIRPETAQEAGKLSGSYKNNRSLLRERAQAGLTYLASQAGIDRENIVAIGYCFGGTTVIELARSGAAFAGAVSFHGGLDSPTPQDDKHIQAPILILHGADDPFVKTSDIAAMRTSFNEANVEWTFVEFSGAVHSFTDTQAGSDPSRGAAYNERADRESWEIFRSYFSLWTGKEF